MERSTDREINLGAVVQVIWDRSRKIFGFSLATAAVVLLASQLLPDRYGARCQLYLKPSDTGVRSMSREKLVSVETYEYFITGEPQLVRILDRFPELRDKPYRLKNAEQLAGRISVDRVGETPIIEIYVEFEESPELSANICNELATQAVALNDRLSAKESEKTADMFRDVLAGRFGKTSELRQSYLDLQQSHQMQLLVAEMGRKQSTLLSRKAELANLEISQTELKERLRSLREKLSVTEPVIPLKRSLTEDSILLEAFRKNQKNVSAEDILRATITVEAENGAYYNLLNQINITASQLDGDLAKYNKISDEVPQFEEELKKLEEQRIQWEMEEEVARSKWLLSHEIQSGIDKEEGWAAATILSNRAVLQILHEAIADDEAESPQRVVMAGVAGTMAFLLVLAYFILRDLHHFVADRTTGVV